MNTNIQSAINIIENSLTGATLDFYQLGLTTKDLICILRDEKYKSFFENLKCLYLSDNEIKELPKGIFSGLKNLKYLYSSHNKIKELPNGVFSGLEKLEYLYLSGNEIKETQQFTGFRRSGGLFTKIK